MSLPNPISQDDVFFIGHWTPFIERSMISKMASELWEGTWIRGNVENNKHVMRTVRNEVEEELGIEIPYADYLAKLTQLEERFRQFKWLISRDDVTFHPATNTVEACPDTWWDIHEIMPNALVYMHNGEACWHLLKDLFVEVIVLSDSTSQPPNRQGLTQSEALNRRSLSQSEARTHRSLSQSEGQNRGSDSQCHSEVVNQSTGHTCSPVYTRFNSPSPSSDEF